MTQVAHHFPASGGARDETRLGHALRARKILRIPVITARNASLAMHPIVIASAFVSRVSHQAT
eukprot:10658386-Lingulodinium_polyedra.AAC.1